MRSRSRYIYLTLLAHSVILVSMMMDKCALGKPETGPRHVGNSGLVCGPRCVHFVLRYYGIPAELIPLIKETQWPQLESGAPLAQLNDALRHRGIFTVMIQMDPDAEIVCDNPVILHCEDSEGRCHYVVQVNHEHKSVIWDGLNGYRNGFPDGFHGTGIAMIASNKPIADSSWRLVNHWRWHEIVLSVGGIMAGGGCVVHIVRRLRKSRQGAAESLVNTLD